MRIFHLPASPLALALILFFAAEVPEFAQKQTVTAIGSRLELFVDTALVESMPGVTLQLHRPVPAETVIKFDSPWEGNGNHYVTVLKDGDLYRMYYRSVPGTVPASGEGWVLYVCYAESRDGICFIKPDLGLVDFKGSKANNIVFSGGGPAPLQGRPWSVWAQPAANFTPFIDANPAAPPAERYKAVGGDGEGLYALVSPDGIHWRQKGTAPIISQDIRPRPNNLFDSQNVVGWNAIQQHYVAYLRDAYPLPGNGEMTRGIRRSVSKDFVNWSDAEWLNFGGQPIDQFYTNAITPYFRAPHIYFGFPMRYMAHRNARLPGEYDSLRGAGVTDSVFISSRDGVNWSRRFLDAFVMPGPDPLNWIDRNNAVALGLVPTGEGEMSVYYIQHFRLPTNHIRRGVLRLDGIVSANASYGGGEIVTKPITFTGRRLVVNYATSAAGSLRVEMQDQEGRPIPGCALNDSVDRFGDSVRQEVSWDSGADVSRWAETPLRLRFVMKDADLYSYQFQP
jgi:hypothetical protein